MVRAACLVLILVRLGGGRQRSFSFFFERFIAPMNAVFFMMPEPLLACQGIKS
jgi:hypothetical protein